jgi:hypothetical protein
MGRQSDRQTNRQTEKHTGMRKLMFVFLNFAKSTKNTKPDAYVKPYVPAIAVYFILCISANGTLLVKLCPAANLVFWYSAQ